MINPAKYDSALKQMTDQQLQLLMKRPDKIPTQFVVKELNRRQQMRRQAKAQEASLSRSAGQPMQMGNEQSMAMMGGQQQPRMMSSGGVTKLSTGTMLDYTKEIQEAYARNDVSKLMEIYRDPKAPDSAKQLALNMVNAGTGSNKKSNTQSNNKAMSTDEMFANAMDTVNPFDESNDVFSNIELGKGPMPTMQSVDDDVQIAQRNINAKNNQELFSPLDKTNQGFDIKKDYKGLEFFRNIGEGVQSFLGVNKDTDRYYDGDASYNQRRYNVKSPINIDEFASNVGEGIVDFVGGAKDFVTTPITLSKEGKSQQAIKEYQDQRKKIDDAKKSNILQSSQAFESGIQPKEDNQFIDLTENFLTEKISPGPRQGNLIDNSVEPPLPKPFENNKIKNSAAETFTGTIVANANTDLSAAGDVDTTNKGIKNNIISQEVKNIFDSDFTQKLAKDGYEKSNYLVKAGEIFDGLSEDNKKIVALHNEQTKDLVKQREKC
jgi:hypothetical protein